MVVVVGGLAIAALLWPTSASATVDTVVEGTVQDDLLAPVVGAEIVLHDAHGTTVRSAITDGAGAFSLSGIPFGDYTVEAHAKGKLEDHRHITVTSAAPTHVELYCLAPQAVTNVVEESAGVPLPSRATGSVSTLSRETLKTLPKGEDRPITEVLGTQPGFVGDAFGNVYARGNHANVQYQIDGIPIPDSVGNLFAQALPVRLIETLEILTGGIPAEFGDRLAAVVNVTTRHGGETPEGLLQMRYGSFQTIEPSGFYSRSFAAGKLGVFLGGSYSQSQRALDPPSVSPILHDDGRNGRAFFRLDWRKSDRDRFEMFGSYAYNSFQIPIDPTVVPLDPSMPGLVRPVDQYGNGSPAFVPHDTNAVEREQEIFVTLSWVRQVTAALSTQLAPYYKLSYGALSSDPLHALGALADPGATTSDVTRSASHAGAVFHLTYTTGHHLIKAGAQLDGLVGQTDYTEYVRNDAGGGIDASQGGHGTDKTNALLSGAYVQDRWDHGRLGLNAGLRFDELHVGLSSGRSNDQWGLSPRLGASFAFTPALIGHAFVGVNWQPPAPLDAGNAARVLGVVPVGTDVPYDIKAETDVYGEAGLDWRAIKALKLRVTGWARYAYNQLDDTAIGSTNLIANYNFERGRAVGVEGDVQLAIGYWLSAFGNLSWEIGQGQGIASAKYLFDATALADHAWQTLDHVQTLTANVGLTVREAGFSGTALLAYGSGLRTGPSNQENVPGHAQVDVTLGYAFEKIPLKPRLAVDVINLFDAKYAFRIANGVVGSSYGAPRSAFVRLSIPLSKGAQP